MNGLDVERLAVLAASAGLIILLTAVGLVALRLAGRRLLAWAQGLTRSPEARQQQLVTLIQIVQWLVVVLLLATAVMMLLSTFGIDITPLLASVGVVGLAVSLGAQTLIKDLIGGLLVLVENQYAVGIRTTLPYGTETSASYRDPWQERQVVLACYQISFAARRQRALRAQRRKTTPH